MTKESIQDYTLRITNANPTEIIAIIFEATEVYLDDAIMSFKDDNMPGFKTGVEKASRCINDLINSLDLQYDIAKQLMSIYLFFNKELAMAIVKRDVISVQRIQAMITKLKLSFEELAKQDTSGTVMGNTQSVYAGLTYGRGALTESTNIQSNRGYTV